jgi:hypothetical protein
MVCEQGGKRKMEESGGCMEYVAEVFMPQYPATLVLPFISASVQQKGNNEVARHAAKPKLFNVTINISLLCTVTKNYAGVDWPVTDAKGVFHSALISRTCVLTCWQQAFHGRLPCGLHVAPAGIKNNVNNLNMLPAAPL